MHDLLVGKNIQIFDKSKVSEGDVVKVTFYWHKEAKRSFWKSKPAIISGSFAAYGIVETVTEDILKVVSSLDREKTTKLETQQQRELISNWYPADGWSQRVILVNKDKLGTYYDVEVVLRLEN